MTQPIDHLDDERLLLELYGAGSEADNRHLHACPACSARFAELKAQRARLLAAQPAPPDAGRLRAQRAAVWAQIGNGRRRPVWRALQAGALAGAVLAGVLLYRPAQPPSTPPAAHDVAHLSDEQLFEDLATMLARETPLAAEPLMGLFVAGTDNEVQKQ
ncbi:MAG: hypothetical protein NZR01_13190 [Bryobacteraceae bacterium]|nr:hypothetical protein [Bryobacteraceae bacterium]